MKTNITKKIISAILSAVLVFQPFGDIIYFPSHSSLNSCVHADPIAYTITSVQSINVYNDQLVPGDTVTVSGGVYNETLNPTVSGVYSNGILFKSADGGEVLVDCINLDQVEYVRIEGLKARSVSQWGITWTFDDYYPVGTFVNDDFWVVGPITVSSVSPPPIYGIDGRNGSMENPAPSGQPAAQAYDSRAYFYSADKGITYPYSMDVNRSLVSTISVDSGSMTYVQTAAVLTSLAASPPADAFRPSYSDPAKTIYLASSLRTDLLPALNPTPATPVLSSVERIFKKVWLDHVVGREGETIHPVDSMPDSGREIAKDVSTGALMLLLDFAQIGDKTALLRNYVQVGIDLYGVAANGGYWPADGACGQGRKFPIIFAGYMLNDPGMLNIGTQVITDTAWRFQEDESTFYVSQADVDLAPRLNTTDDNIWPPEAAGAYYLEADIDMPEWGIYHRDYPEYDDRYWDDPSYGAFNRVDCGSVWGGFILASRALGLKTAWNHDALFDYTDRFMTVETRQEFRTKDGNESGSFHANMWDRYRADYGPIWPFTGNFAPPVIDILSANKLIYTEGESVNITLMAHDTDGVSPDIDLDGDVDISDFGTFQISGDPRCDFNQNGILGPEDLLDSTTFWDFFRGAVTRSWPIVYVELSKDGAAYTPAAPMIATLDPSSQGINYRWNYAWTPGVGEVGDYVIRFAVFDGTTTTEGQVSFNVTAAPIITIQPADQSVNKGQTAVFSVTAIGNGTLTYQWQKNAENLIEGGKISGSTTANLNIANSVLSDEGSYLCIAANEGGFAVSDAAVLTVLIPDDTDDDGMPDAWETTNGLNPNDPSDASLDLDNDGLTNLQEYILGINPNNSDTDGDGMPDGWEIAHALNPLDNSDAQIDSDVDGFSNIIEYGIGTDPSNPDTDGDGMPDGDDPDPLVPNNITGNWPKLNNGYPIDGGEPIVDSYGRMLTSVKNNRGDLYYIFNSSGLGSVMGRLTSGGPAAEKKWELFSDGEWINAADAVPTSIGNTICFYDHMDLYPIPGSDEGIFGMGRIPGGGIRVSKIGADIHGTMASIEFNYFNGTKLQWRQWSNSNSFMPYYMKDMVNSWNGSLGDFDLDPSTGIGICAGLKGCAVNLYFKNGSTWDDPVGDGKKYSFMSQVTAVKYTRDAPSAKWQRWSSGGWAENDSWPGDDPLACEAAGLFISGKTIDGTAPPYFAFREYWPLIKNIGPGRYLLLYGRNKAEGNAGECYHLAYRYVDSPPSWEEVSSPPVGGDGISYDDLGTREVFNPRDGVAVLIYTRNGIMYEVAYDDALAATNPWSEMAELGPASEFKAAMDSSGVISLFYVTTDGKKLFMKKRHSSGIWSQGDGIQVYETSEEKLKVAGIAFLGLNDRPLVFIAEGSEDNMRMYAIRGNDSESDNYWAPAGTDYLNIDEPSFDSVIDTSKVRWERDVFTAAGHYGNPYSGHLALDRDNYIYAPHPAVCNIAVAKVDAEDYTEAVAKAAVWGGFWDHIIFPGGCAVDNVSGKMYVTNRILYGGGGGVSNGSFISVFDKEGAFLNGVPKNIGYSGINPDYWDQGYAPQTFEWLGMPSDVAVDEAKGLLFITNSSMSQIKVYDIRNLVNIDSYFDTSGLIYWSGGTNIVIDALVAAGYMVWHDQAAQQIKWAVGVELKDVVDYVKELQYFLGLYEYYQYGLERYLGTLYKNYHDLPKYLGTFGDNCPDPLDNLNFPQGIDVDPEGYLYVADSANHRINKYNIAVVDGDIDGKPDGISASLLWHKGGMGRGEGKFIYPFSVAADPHFKLIYVTDPFNNRVQIFDRDGNFIYSWNKWDFPQGYTPPWNGNLKDFSKTFGIVADGKGNIHAGVGQNIQTFTFRSTLDTINSNGIPDVLEFPDNELFKMADAGDDQAIVDLDISVDEVVTLDGSRSAAPPGETISSYEWREKGVKIAEGLTPSITLAAGDHLIELIVTTAEGSAGRDDVNITIDSLPNMINNGDFEGEVVVWQDVDYYDWDNLYMVDIWQTGYASDCHSYYSSLAFVMPGRYDVYQDVSGVESGKRYRFIAWVNDFNPDLNFVPYCGPSKAMYVEWFDSSGAAIRNEVCVWQSVAPLPDWYKVLVDLIAPAGAVSARVKLTANTAVFDDIGMFLMPTNDTTPLTLVKAVSRKLHKLGSREAGPFDIALPGIEPRQWKAGNEIILFFNREIQNDFTVTMSQGLATPTLRNGKEIVLTVNNAADIPDQAAILITANNVKDLFGNSLPVNNNTVYLYTLIGDVNGDGIVTSGALGSNSDQGLVLANYVNLLGTLNNTNFIYDLNLDKLVNASDSTLVLNNAGHTIVFGPPNPGDLPLIITQPKSQQIDFNKPVNLVTFAIGPEPISYQWQEKDAGNTWIDILGENQGTYTIMSTSAEDNGFYRASITNPNGTILTNEAELRIGFPIQITAQPQDQSVVPGQDATFAVAVTGSEPIQYQWQKETGPDSWMNIQDAVSSSLIISAVTIADRGSYRFLASNLFGQIESASAVLTVNEINAWQKVNKGSPVNINDDLFSDKVTPVLFTAKNTKGDLLYFVTSKKIGTYMGRFTSGGATPGKKWELFSDGLWKDEPDTVPTSITNGMAVYSRMKIFNRADDPESVFGMGSLPFGGARFATRNFDMHGYPVNFVFDGANWKQWKNNSTYSAYSLSPIISSWSGTWGTGVDFDLNPGSKTGIMVGVMGRYINTGNYNQLGATKYSQSTNDPVSGKWTRWEDGAWGTHNEWNPEYFTPSAAILKYEPNAAQYVDPRILHLGANNYLVLFGYYYVGGSRTAAARYSEETGSPRWSWWNGADWEEQGTFNYAPIVTPAIPGEIKLLKVEDGAASILYVNDGKIYEIVYDETGAAHDKFSTPVELGSADSWTANIDPNKTVWLAFSRGRNIYLRTKPLNGAWTQEAQISGQNYLVSVLDINFTGGGNFPIIFYSSVEGNRYKIYALADPDACQLYWQDEEPFQPAALPEAINLDTNKFSLVNQVNDGFPEAKYSGSTESGHMAIDNDGYLYSPHTGVCNIAIRQKDVLDKNLNHGWGAGWDWLAGPGGIAVDNVRKKVYVTNDVLGSIFKETGQLLVFDMDKRDEHVGFANYQGQMTDIWNRAYSPQIFNANLSWGSDLAVNGTAGKLYVTDSAYSRINIYDLDNLQDIEGSYFYTSDLKREIGAGADGCGGGSDPTLLAIVDDIINALVSHEDLEWAFQPVDGALRWKSGDLSVLITYLKTLSEYDSFTEADKAAIERNIMRSFKSFRGLPRLLSKFGSEGSGQGQFRFPQSIDVDPDGNIYIADTGNHRIQKFDSNFNFLKTWGQLGRGEDEFIYPYSVACDPKFNLVYVVDPYNQRVQIFDRNGNYIYSWAEWDIPPGVQGKSDFDVTYGCVADGAGNLFVGVYTDVAKFSIANADVDADKDGIPDSLKAPDPFKLMKPVIEPVPDSMTGDVTVEWNDLGGATMYHIQIATDDAFTAGVVDNFPTASEMVFSGLANGTYFVRVRATANADIPFNFEAGPLSKWSNDDSVQPVSFVVSSPTQDSDSDGMPDVWEKANGLNPNDKEDASLDLDNDGLANLREYQLGTNPNNSDTDGDGMPDGWEIAHGLNPNDPGDLPEVDFANHAIAKYPQNEKLGPDGRVDARELQIISRYWEMAPPPGGFDNDDDPLTSDHDFGVVDFNHDGIVNQPDLEIFQFLAQARYRKVFDINLDTRLYTLDLMIMNSRRITPATMNVPPGWYSYYAYGDLDMDGDIDGDDYAIFYTEYSRGLRPQNSKDMNGDGINNYLDISWLEKYNGLTPGSINPLDPYIYDEATFYNYDFIPDGIIDYLDCRKFARWGYIPAQLNAGELLNFSSVMTSQFGDGRYDPKYDANGDGMINREDYNYYLNDFDHDGLPDDQEAILGTDPNNPDTDGDGITDGDEVFRYKTDPTLKDTDGDGWSDLVELNNGSDPLDPSKTPSLNAIVKKYDDTDAVFLGVLARSGLTSESAVLDNPNIRGLDNPSVFYHSGRLNFIFGDPMGIHYAPPPARYTFLDGAMAFTDHFIPEQGIHLEHFRNWIAKIPDTSDWDEDQSGYPDARSLVQHPAGRYNNTGGAIIDLPGGGERILFAAYLYHSSPTTANNVAFVFSDDNFLIQAEVKDPLVLWDYDDPGNGANRPNPYLGYSMREYKGHVYAMIPRSPGGPVLLRAKTKDVLDRPAGELSISDWHYLVSVDAQTGEAVWSSSGVIRGQISYDQAQFPDNYIPPVNFDETPYIISSILWNPYMNRWIAIDTVFSTKMWESKYYWGPYKKVATINYAVSSYNAFSHETLLGNNGEYIYYGRSRWPESGFYGADYVKVPVKELLNIRLSTKSVAAGDTLTIWVKNLSGLTSDGIPSEFMVTVDGNGADFVRQNGDEYEFTYTATGNEKGGLTGGVVDVEAKTMVLKAGVATWLKRDAALVVNQRNELHAQVISHHNNDAISGRLLLDVSTSYDAPVEAPGEGRPEVYVIKTELRDAENDTEIVEDADTASPYQLRLDTTKFVNGPHAFKIIAYDTLDRRAEEIITLDINNPDASVAGNLAQDGNLELEMTGPWISYAGAEISKTRGQDRHSGARSLLIKNITPSTEAGAVNAVSGLTGGESLRFTAWAKMILKTPPQLRSDYSIYWQVYKADNTILVSGQCQPWGIFQKIYAEFTNPADNTELYIRFSVIDMNSVLGPDGWVEAVIDDVVLRDTSYPEIEAPAGLSFAIRGSSNLLTWAPTSDANVEYYYIYRKLKSETDDYYKKIGEANIYITSYEDTDCDAIGYDQVAYRLKAVDYMAAQSEFSGLADLVTLPVVDPVLDQSANEGEAATFSVTATGSALHYDWQKWNGTDWATLSNDAPSYTKSNVGFADHQMRLRVIVSNAVGAVTSNEAALKVTLVTPVTQAIPTSYDGAFKADFSDVPGAAIYQVQITSASGTGEYFPTVSEITDTYDNGQYSVRVRAAHTNMSPIDLPENILSDWSDPVIFDINKITPMLNAPAAVNKDFELSWTELPMAGIYEIQESGPGRAFWPGAPISKQTITVAGLIDGTYSYKMRAWTAAPENGGSSTLFSNSVTVTIDKTAPGSPTVTISPALTGGYTKIPNITLSGDKEANSSILVNGVVAFALNPDITWQSAYTLTEGNNQIIIKSKDLAGNESAPVTISAILKTSSKINIIWPLTNYVKAADLIPGTTDINIQYRIDDVAAAGVKRVTLKEGETVTVPVSDQDILGNIASETLSLMLDTVAPTIAVVATNQTTTSSTATVTGTVMDAGSGINSITVNGVPAIITGNSYSAVIDLSSGANAITVVAQDRSGNTTTMPGPPVYYTPPAGSGDNGSGSDGGSDGNNSGGNNNNNGGGGYYPGGYTIPANTINQPPNTSDFFPNSQGKIIPPVEVPAQNEGASPDMQETPEVPVPISADESTLAQWTEDSAPAVESYNEYAYKYDSPLPDQKDYPASALDAETEKAMPEKIGAEPAGEEPVKEPVEAPPVIKIKNVKKVMGWRLYQLEMEDNTEKLSWALAEGQKLPFWLQFDGEKGSIYGFVWGKKKVDLKLIVTTPDGETVEAACKLVIE